MDSVEGKSYLTGENFNRLKAYIIKNNKNKLSPEAQYKTGTVHYLVCVDVEGRTLVTEEHKDVITIHDGEMISAMLHPIYTIYKNPEGECRYESNEKDKTKAEEKARALFDRVFGYLLDQGVL